MRIWSAQPRSSHRRRLEIIQTIMKTAAQMTSEWLHWYKYAAKSNPATGTWCSPNEASDISPVMTRKITRMNGIVKANKSGNTPQKPVQAGLMSFGFPFFSRSLFAPLAPALAHNVCASMSILFSFIIRLSPLLHSLPVFITFYPILTTFRTQFMTNGTIMFPTMLTIQ